MCACVHLQEAEDEQEDRDPSTATDGLGQPSLPPALPLLQKESIKTTPTAYRQTSTLKHVEAEGDNNIKLQTVRNVIKKENNSELKNMSSNLCMSEEMAETSGGDVRCSVCKGTGALMSSHLRSVEGGREPHPADKSVEFLGVDYFLITKTQTK